MNEFMIDGVVVGIGEKRNDRAPTPYLIQTEGYKGKVEEIPLDIFNDGLNLGDKIKVTGRLSSFEYNRKIYPCVKTFSVEVMEYADGSEPEQKKEEKTTKTKPKPEESKTEKYPAPPKSKSAKDEDDIPF